MIAYLLVNFGGPRELSEIVPFLTELLTDRDVIRNHWPPFFHRWFFTKIAQKRGQKIVHDYEKIGGKSPIFFDTEKIGDELRNRLSCELFTFHRYLPSTHEESLKKIESCSAKELHVIPLFPQFCYGTTGSIARFFQTHLSQETLNKLRWVSSYATHPRFIQAYQKRLSSFLEENKIRQEEAVLLFSAHGVPLSFIQTGDPYQKECEESFAKIKEAFPNALSYLCYQSKFGRGEWVRPYTNETCERIASLAAGRKKVVTIPMSFTSDHIETLFEIEEQYLPVIRASGLQAFRCPALNLEPYWVEGLVEICKIEDKSPNHLLVRT